MTYNKLKPLNPNRTHGLEELQVRAPRGAPRACAARWGASELKGFKILGDLRLGGLQA